MQKRWKRIFSCVLAAAMVLPMNLNVMGKTEKAAGTGGKGIFKEVIEFEDANHFEQNGRNQITSSGFSGYSGSGYLYLVSGWGEVNFTVPQDGEYKITIAANADCYKENWLYLDESGAGTLYTQGNQWQETTGTYTLSAGTHKFGVSASWGYTALDYVVIESVSPIKEEPTPTPTPTPTPVPEETYVAKVEFEDSQRFEGNGKNRITSSEFSGYSGSGYLYLTSGWGEVGFSVPKDGEYRITLVSNADTYKENWLYLDDNSAGTLYTSGNRWEGHSNTYTLSAGEHKFGVSASWGYTALDYVLVEEVSKRQDDNLKGDGMYVRNGKLYDGDGNEFLMRGVNVAHAWYPEYTQTSINAVADLGANCVRVVLADGSRWTKTTYTEVENIIAWCEARGLVCILEVHDPTGIDDINSLNSAVNYWIELKDLVNAHKDYVIVNIANEWIQTWNQGSLWSNGYQSAIRTLRNVGIENVIMVDAPGYGQEAAPCIDNCQSVLAADPTGNTMFSIHMYSVAGKDAYTVRSNIDGMRAKGVCFCIGEFGDFQSGEDVDEETIMRYCTEKEVGYLAWSWKGNSGMDVTLDMAYDWEGKNLTNWGRYVFCADGIGIQATSVMAYTLKTYQGWR